jgi:3-hydroxybutyryl-CoA dehydrogenase
MPMINEAILTLEENVSGVEEIDTVMILGMSHPMGPLHLADFIGLDVCLSILDVMYKGFNNEKYIASKLLSKMVTDGNLGIKSGKGFYDYSEGPRNKKVSSEFIR